MPETKMYAQHFYLDSDGIPKTIDSIEKELFDANDKLRTSYSRIADKIAEIYRLKQQLTTFISLQAENAALQAKVEAAGQVIKLCTPCAHGDCRGNDDPCNSCSMNGGESDNWQPKEDK